MTMLGNEIFCAKCGKVISTDYNADRGHAETELYTHRCEPKEAMQDGQARETREL